MNSNNQMFRFSLASLMMIMVGLALLLALWRISPELFMMTITGAAIANVLGLILGWFVTSGLGYPTDGTLRSEGKSWAAETLEMEETDSDEPVTEPQIQVWE